MRSDQLLDYIANDIKAIQIPSAWVTGDDDREFTQCDPAEINTVARDRAFSLAPSTAETPANVSKKSMYQNYDVRSCEAELVVKYGFGPGAVANICKDMRLIVDRLVRPQLPKGNADIEIIRITHSDMQFITSSPSQAPLHINVIWGLYLQWRAKEGDH